MKTIVALFLACFATALFGQAPPITRGPWTTNAVPTNGIALTPSFYGNIGIGIASASAATVMEFASGASDQQPLITRPNGTSYANWSVRTSGGDLWQMGLQNGDDYWHLRNTGNGAQTYVTRAGEMFIETKAGGGFADNVLNIMGHTNYSALVAWAPGSSFGGGAASTFGYGPSGANYPGPYIGLSPPSGVGVPPDFRIAQESNGLPHIRIFIMSNAPNYDVLIPNYHSTLSTGTVTALFRGNGDTAFGDPIGTNKTFLPGAWVVGPNSNFVVTVRGSSATGPGMLDIWSTTNGVTNRIVATINGTNGNVGINTNAPGAVLDVAGNAIVSDLTVNGGDVNGPSFVNIQVGGVTKIGAGGSQNQHINTTHYFNNPVGIGTTVPLAQVHTTNAASQPTASMYTSRTNSNLLTFSGTTLVTSIETNGFANYSTQATNELVATGYTNTTGVNMQAMVNATAVSFTVNNRAGTVIYTSPVLTGVVPVGLQPGWSIRGASGLAGTVIPGL